MTERQTGSRQRESHSKHSPWHSGRALRLRVLYHILISAEEIPARHKIHGGSSKTLSHFCCYISHSCFVTSPEQGAGINLSLLCPKGNVPLTVFLGTGLRSENDALERVGHISKLYQLCSEVADPYAHRPSPSISSLATETCAMKIMLKAARPWCRKYPEKGTGQEASTPALTFCR